MSSSGRVRKESESVAEGRADLADSFAASRRTESEEGESSQVESCVEVFS